VLLLAPVWMQIVHLLVADLLWIAFVLLGAQVMRAAPYRLGRQADSGFAGASVTTP